MRYIKDKEKLNYLKNSTKKEDKDFLLNFMDMPEEEAQKYLATINVGSKAFEIIIKKLIKEEEDAISSYNEAYAVIKNEKLLEIKRDEEEHKKELEEMLYGNIRTQK